MAHHQRARIGPSDESVVLAAVDLHLVLIEAVPEIAGDDADRGVEARWDRRWQKARWADARFGLASRAESRPWP